MAHALREHKGMDSIAHVGFISIFKILLHAHLLNLVLCGDGFCDLLKRENCITCPMDCKEDDCGMSFINMHNWLCS